MEQILTPEQVEHHWQTLRQQLVEQLTKSKRYQLIKDEENHIEYVSPYHQHQSNEYFSNNDLKVILKREGNTLTKTLIYQHYAIQGEPLTLTSIFYLDQIQHGADIIPKGNVIPNSQLTSGSHLIRGRLLCLQLDKTERPTSTVYRQHNELPIWLTEQKTKLNALNPTLQFVYYCCYLNGDHPFNLHANNLYYRSWSDVIGLFVTEKGLVILARDNPDYQEISKDEIARLTQPQLRDLMLVKLQQLLYPQYAFDSFAKFPEFLNHPVFTTYLASLFDFSGLIKTANGTTIGISYRNNDLNIITHPDYEHSDQPHQLDLYWDEKEDSKGAVIRMMYPRTRETQQENRLRIPYTGQSFLLFYSQIFYSLLNSLREVIQHRLQQSYDRQVYDLFRDFKKEYGYSLVPRYEKEYYNHMFVSLFQNNEGIENILRLRCYREEEQSKDDDLIYITASEDLILDLLIRMKQKQEIEMYGDLTLTHYLLPHGKYTSSFIGDDLIPWIGKSSLNQLMEQWGLNLEKEKLQFTTPKGRALQFDIVPLICLSKEQTGEVLRQIKQVSENGLTVSISIGVPKYSKYTPGYYYQIELNVYTGEENLPLFRKRVESTPTKWGSETSIRLHHFLKEVEEVNFTDQVLQHLQDNLEVIDGLVDKVEQYRYPLLNN